MDKECERQIETFECELWFAFQVNRYPWLRGLLGGQRAIKLTCQTCPSDRQAGTESSIVALIPIFSVH